MDAVTLAAKVRDFCERYQASWGFADIGRTPGLRNLYADMRDAARGVLSDARPAARGGKVSTV